MTVYQRAYRGYTGDLAGSFARPWAIARYGLADLFASKLFLAFFFACFLPSVVFMIVIYLRYNLEALAQFQISLGEGFVIDADFFASYLHPPLAVFSFLMVLLVGPALVSPDLRNNALPLYLSRPLTKLDYVLGKLIVLIVLTSAISWVPGVLLFLLQASLGESGWVWQNLHIPVAMVVSSLAWIVILSMIALAISAWVKWKLVARLGFLGLVFVSSAMGSVISRVFGDWKGAMINLFDIYHAIVSQLYGVPPDIDIPALAPWTMALVIVVVASLALFRRIRAFEVVS